MIKKGIQLTTVLLFVAVFLVSAQDDKEKANGYEFEILKELENTPVKNQFRSGTCWSFSAVSFLESEMLKMGKPEVDLSESWIIRHSYSDKAKCYVRWHGHLNFA